MTKSSAFRDMSTAPQDGSLVEVHHGPPDQEIVQARWSGQRQAFVRDDDPLRRSLHRVTGWRPATGTPRPFRSITSAPTHTAVEVIHGPSQAVTLAKWDKQLQVWIKANGPDRRVLNRVTGWRTAEE